MKKLTINKSNSIIKTLSSDTQFSKVINIDGEELTLEVRTDLKIQERSNIVDFVANGVYTQQGYAPEYRDLLFAWKIIDVMTNLTAPTTKDKSIDYIKMQKWINDSSLMQEIVSIDSKVADLVVDLKNLIDAKIEFQKQLIIHSSRSDELVDSVTILLENMSEVASVISDKIQNLNVNDISPLIKDVLKVSPSLDQLKGILDVGVKTDGDVGSKDVLKLGVAKPEVVE